MDRLLARRIYTNETHRPGYGNNKLRYKQVINKQKTGSGDPYILTVTMRSLGRLKRIRVQRMLVRRIYINELVQIGNNNLRYKQVTHNLKIISGTLLVSLGVTRS